MIYYIFMITEWLAITIKGANEFINLFQYPLALFIAYYTAVNNSRKNLNSLLAIFVFSSVICFCEYIFYPWPDIAKMSIVAIFVWFLSFQRYKDYDFKGHKYNKENVCFAFYKARSFRGYILSLFGSDVCSMSVICGDTWARYRRSKGSLVFDKFYPNRLKGKYILIDTGIKINPRILRALKQIEGTPSRQSKTLFLRINCVRSLKSALKELGTFWEYKFLDILPSFYLIRRIGK